MPNVLGGVSNVVNNIISGTELFCGVHVIRYREKNDKREESGEITARCNVVDFEYDARDNFYYTAKRLKKHLPEDIHTIVATDSVELNMIQALRMDKKVVFIVMGDFDHYYSIAVRNSSIIDGFIAISQSIYNQLISRLPENRREDVHISYFPTPSVIISTKQKPGGNLRALFSGRLEPVKNPLAIISIDDCLKRNGIIIDWTIVGDGPLGEQMRSKAEGRNNIKFTGFVSNAALHDLYLEHDILIFPSMSEGLPVTIIEAMKSGVVPVASNIQGGITEIILHGENGFLCNPDLPDSFSNEIVLLNSKRELLEKMSILAIQSANDLFNERNNSLAYFKLINNRILLKEDKIFKHLGSRLDQPWINNRIVNIYRSLNPFS